MPGHSPRAGIPQPFCNSHLGYLSRIPINRHMSPFQGLGSLGSQPSPYASCPALTSPPARARPWVTAVLLTVTGRSRGLRCLSSSRKQRAQREADRMSFGLWLTRQEGRWSQSHTIQTDGTDRPWMLRLLHLAKELPRAWCMTALEPHSVGP